MQVHCWPSVRILIYIYAIRPVRATSLKRVDRNAVLSAVCPASCSKMHSALKLTVVLVLAGWAGAASIPTTTKRLSAPVAEALMVITPAPAPTQAPTTGAAEPAPSTAASTGTTQKDDDDKANHGRGFYKSDDDYPTGHSGHDASLYPAGHSAPDGLTYSEHDDEHYDHTSKPYHHHHHSSVSAATHFAQ